MLKTTKILVFGMGAIAVAAGGYYVYDQTLRKEKKIIRHKKAKVYDTIPETDSSLEKLKQILADNNAAKENVVERNPVVVEKYSNIDENSALYDSLVAEGLVADVNVKNTLSNVVENKTIIKADKFLEKREIEIVGWDKQTATNDTLIHNLVNIKKSKEGKVLVEFWESPVNYKGYRLTRDKMTLFGIIPDGVILVNHKSELFLVTLNNVYQVKTCVDFCHLKPIKDKTICAEVMRYVD